MSDIDFQNGFLCGMATKGLVRSGQLYQPLIWNDSGVYDYFYIDFRRAMEAFSLGMWNESIVVHDSVQLQVAQIAEGSYGVYKITCDIRGKKNGITVLNKKTSRLRFASGERVSVFSTHMFIAGQASNIDGGYFYEKVNFARLDLDFTENVVALMYPPVEAGSYLETIAFALPTITASETATITLT